MRGIINFNFYTSLFYLTITRQSHFSTINHRMNPFKFCPNCKSENTVFSQHHRFECFDCELVFYQNIAAAVAVIIEKDDEILFTVRNAAPKKGMIDLPGGFVDPGETVEEACSRELKEELNLTIPATEFTYFTSAPNCYTYKGIVYRTADMIFTTAFPDKVDFKLENEEIKAIQWIKKTTLDTTKIGFQSLQLAVKAYLKP